MKIKKSIQRWGAWLAMKQFRLSEFNALLPVDSPEGLAELLAEDNAAPPYAGSRGLHLLRWVLFDPQRRNDEPSRSPQALVFSLVGDGNVQGVLASVLDRAGPRVREILQHCRGFDARSDADVIAYLEKHRLSSQYLFRDIGPFFFAPADVPSDPTAPVAAPPDKSELMTALENLRTAVVLSFTQPPDPRPDPTVAELQDAFDMRQRFLAFLSEHGGAGPKGLREGFLRSFADTGFPHPLTPFERRIPHEESWTRRIIDTSRKVQEAAARQRDGKLRRTIHAKGHGSIHAKLKVVPSENGVGLFSVQRTYDAILRPSNGASVLQGDRVRDARGLALRVFVPKDLPLGNGKAPQFLEENDQPSG